MMVVAPTARGKDEEAEPETTATPFTVIVALADVLVGVTETDEVPFGTLAVYEVVAGANDGDNVTAPPFRVKLDKVSMLDGTAYVVVAVVPVPIRFMGVTVIV